MNEFQFIVIFTRVLSLNHVRRHCFLDALVIPHCPVVIHIAMQIGSMIEIPLIRDLMVNKTLHLFILFVCVLAKSNISLDTKRKSNQKNVYLMNVLCRLPRSHGIFNWHSILNRCSRKSNELYGFANYFNKLYEEHKWLFDVIILSGNDNDHHEWKLISNRIHSNIPTQCTHGWQCAKTDQYTNLIVCWEF